MPCKTAMLQKELFAPVLCALSISAITFASIVNAAPPPRGPVAANNPAVPNNQTPAPRPATLSLTIPSITEVDAEQQALQDLGKQIFFDRNLSNPVGQACASCHAPEAGFADPDQSLASSEGAVAGVFGNRNSPTISYSQFIPPFQNAINRRGGQARGGLFLDGRADTLEEQAKAPFFNRLEMNNASIDDVIAKLAAAPYADQFRAIFGADALLDTTQAFEQLATAIAAFERSQQVSPFTSRFDNIVRGQDVPETAEIRGFRLFTGRAGCVTCHNSNNGTAQVFSDFSYANIGVPSNPDLPFFDLDTELNPQGNNFVDLGLGGVTGLARQNGQFRVPTLRNVSLTAPYMHNGVFATLQEVVEFYNSRDVNPELFPAEVNANISRRGGIGNLRLSDNDIQDLVAFLNALSDNAE